ncbi:T9SS type A sorting domain-containing protein [Flavobacterium sp.]|uniref:T9SS type A sorting domain-containing protein n=1 Tax=Flavobacterium sp. TaxID=239 RepID=UPI00262AE33B|nr:T9SS type A sorting domain-containing protein [Flavobacterium sp.]
MKAKIILVMTLITSLFTVMTSKAQEDQINLIAFKYNQQSQTSDIIKWNVDAPELFTATSSNVTGILVGTSIFNASTGDYVSRVTQNDNTSGVFKYNANTQQINFNEATSFFNGSAECDMQTGFIYTYDGNNLNEVQLNKYNPQTNELVVVGTFDFLPNTSFFPDGSCFDSNTGTYYFVMQDAEGKKLVTVPVNATAFTYTETLLTGLPITGNIGLEYSNETNSIYCIYSSFNAQTESNTFVVGNLDANSGAISVLNTLETIGGYQFYNRTFDQNTKKLLFVAYNLDFTQQRLYLYDIDSNTYETRLLPAELVVEIECNNFAYSERKYGQLSTPTFDGNDLVIYQDIAAKSILFSKNIAKSKFQVVNMQGAIVISGQVSSTNAIDASTLQSGIYIVSVEVNSKKVDKKLILK